MVPSPTPERPRAVAAPTFRRRTLFRVAAALLTLGIFLVDVLTTLEGAVAVLYVVAVLLVARTGRRADIVIAAVAGIVLTLAAYVDSHGLNHVGSQTFRALVSLAAIGITALLALQHQLAYAALVRSERRYRRMFDASRIGVVQEDWRALRTLLGQHGIVNADALQAHLAAHPAFLRQARRLPRIDDVNPAFMAMLQGRDGRHHPIDSLDQVLNPQDASFAGALSAFVAGAPFHEGETEMVAADGRCVPVLFAITFPVADDGDASVLVFVVDNSERRQAQDAALRAQAELAHAARVATLGELTASLAHEVNQPLMAVVTNGEAGLRWLHRDHPDLQEVAAAITRTVSEARRASEIVKRVRSFLAKRSTPRDVVDVSTLIDDAARLVQHELSRTAVQLRVEVAPGLPPLLGDALQLQQVLVNLLINASQAMAGQAAARHLRVEAQPGAGGEVVICITDSGPGIDSAHLDTLFQPFFTTKPEGMGMGLAICRSTAEAHGGTLSVDSTPGQGATFRLVLATPHAEGMPS